MKLDIRFLEATLDEAQALIDAETNAQRILRARLAINVFRGRIESLRGDDVRQHISLIYPFLVELGEILGGEE